MTVDFSSLLTAISSSAGCNNNRDYMRKFLLAVEAPTATSRDFSSSKVL